MCGWHCYTLAAKKLSLFVHCADVLSCACRYVPDSAESCAFSASHPYLVLLKFIIMTVYVLVWSMMADFARILNSLHQPCDILLVLRAHILTEISSLQVPLAFALLDAPFSRKARRYQPMPTLAIGTCHLDVGFLCLAISARAGACGLTSVGMIILGAAATECTVVHTIHADVRGMAGRVSFWQVAFGTVAVLRLNAWVWQLLHQPFGRRVVGPASCRERHR